MTSHASQSLWWFLKVTRALHVFMGLMGHLCLKENSIRSSWHHGSAIPMFHLPSLRSMHEVTVRWLRLKQDSEWRPLKQQGKIWKTITHWVPPEWFFIIFNDSYTNETGKIPMEWWRCITFSQCPCLLEHHCGWRLDGSMLSLQPTWGLFAWMGRRYIYEKFIGIHKL